MTEPITITLSVEDWEDVRTMFDDKAPAEDPPGVERLFEVWRQHGLLRDP